MAAVISPNIFSQCLPALSTDYARCGSVTLCDVNIPTSDELEGIFKSADGDYRFSEALYIHDLEVRACQARQNGLYDFLMAQKVNVSRKQQISEASRGIYEIKPFITGLRKNLINNEYWEVSGGTASGLNWQVDLESNQGIPIDTRWFHVGQRVHIRGQSAGGSATETAWKILTVTLVAGKIRLLLETQNGNSFLPADKLEYPVVGVLRTGTPNVNRYEAFCEQIPGLNTNSQVPYWIEETRSTWCQDELYEKYFKLLKENNPMFRTYGDIETVQLVKQIGEKFQRDWVNSFFWNKALPNQTLANFDQLESINTVTSGSIYNIQEGRCIGKRANAIGIYEQLAECGRIFDLQGDTLSLPELFNLLYSIKRVREGNGETVNSIDIFTDEYFASRIHLAMQKYYNQQYDGQFRMTMDVNDVGTKTTLGFVFSKYKLIYPAGLVINIITHKFFDDAVTEAKNANIEATGRMLWILDFNTIYPGVIDSWRRVNQSGDINTLAAVDNNFMCVGDVPRRKQTLMGLVWTAIVDCPSANAILENIGNGEPAIVADATADNYQYDLGE